MRDFKRRSHLLVTILLILITSTPVFAISVNLAWDANTESNLAGYKVYYGGASRTYGTAINVGNITSYSVTGLGPGTYYFAVTAYSLNNESGYSNEYSITLTCTSSLSPTGQSFASSDVLSNVNVTVPAGCNWTATSNASFITINSGSSGSGDGSVSYSVAANTSTSQRTGTMTIAGQTFTVTQQGAPPVTLTVPTTPVLRGGSVTASWAGIPSPTASDWIGLYASSGAADNAGLSYSYTNGLASGTLPFAVPVIAVAGTTYELRLFSNNSYTRLATSNTFTIQATTLTVLSASPLTVSAGGSVIATWTNLTNASATDWIGLYNSSEAPNYPPISWRYSNGLALGNALLTIPAGLPEATTYELRLFSNNSYTRLATSNSFEIRTPTISASAATVSTGETVTATWTNILNPTTKDWIGLFAMSGAANTEYVTFRYTNGLASGDVSFTIPAGALTGTTYELRLFSNNSYTRLATSNSFTVRATTLSANPTMVAPGGSVTATWTNIANPTATDWIGLYPSSGAANGSYISFRYTNGQASSNEPFTIPAGTAPGTTYELRLFPNNSYTRLATSNSFTVQVATLSSSPATVSPGGSITATWTNIASPTAIDWIGLYTSSAVPNTAYLSYRYTNGLASSNLPFTIPGGAAPGTTYELRLFTNGGYTRLATSNIFTVAGPLAPPSVSSTTASNAVR